MRDGPVIMQVIDKMGFALPDNSPLRWRALIGTLRKELEDGEDPVDYVVLFERLLQLVSPSIKPERQAQSV